MVAKPKKIVIIKIKPVFSTKSVNLKVTKRVVSGFTVKYLINLGLVNNKRCEVYVVITRLAVEVTLK